MNKFLKPLRSIILFLTMLIAIVSQAQSLRSLMANACAGGGSEGENEYAIFFNANDSLEVHQNNIFFSYGNTYPASTTYSDSFVNGGNSGYVSKLNAYLNGTCDYSFRNTGYRDTIPDNHYFLIMYENPTDTLDYNDWCGSGIGDVYVVFSADPSWSRYGNFVNNPSNYRHLRVILKKDTQDFSYTGGWSSNKDGNYAHWIDTGQASSYNNYPHCTPDNPDALPVELIHFSAEETGDQQFLIWITASETNNLGFEIEASRAGGKWDNIGFEPGYGNSLQLRHYRFQLNNAHHYKYYRLLQKDYDGQSSYSDPISPQFEAPNSFYYRRANHELVITMDEVEPQRIKAVNPSGKSFNIPLANNGLEWIGDLNNLTSGVYTVMIEYYNEIESGKLIILQND